MTHIQETLLKYRRHDSRIWHTLFSSLTQRVCVQGAGAGKERGLRRRKAPVCHDSSSFYQPQKLSWGSLHPRNSNDSSSRDVSWCTLVWVMSFMSHVLYESCLVWVMSSMSHVLYESCLVWVMSCMSHVFYESWHPDWQVCCKCVMSCMSHVFYESCLVWVMSSMSHVFYESCLLWVMSSMSHVLYESCLLVYIYSRTNMRWASPLVKHENS